MQISQRQRRVWRTAPATATDLAARKPEFACAYAVRIEAGDARSSEEWARAAWEGSPAPLRGLMLVGWRHVLRLRLGPRSSHDHILGWTIVHRGPDETVCQLRSPFLEAFNTFRHEGERLVWSTFVFYQRPIARLIWPPASLVHRRLVPIALATAQRGADALPPN